MPALRAFAQQLACTLVVTQPDRPAGRGQRLRPTPVKRAAAELGIPTVEPERLPQALPLLAAEEADLFAVASYGKIVPPAVLALPRSGALNVHPSLLPLYRGATPLQSQLRDGVVASAVTIIAMDAGLDTGDIVLQRPASIGPRETYGELHDRFAELGATVLAEACERAANGTLERVPQRLLERDAEARATATRPLRKEDYLLGGPWGRSTMQGLVDHVRALAPAPGARTALPSFSSAKVLAARPWGDGPNVDVAVGEVVAVEGWLLMRASDGWIVLERVVLPGRHPMTSGEFRAGNRLTGPAHLAAPLRAWLAGQASLLTTTGAP